MIADGKIILGGTITEEATHQCNECGQRFNGYPLWMRCCCKASCPC